MHDAGWNGTQRMSIASCLLSYWHVRFCIIVYVSGLEGGGAEI